MVAVLGNMLMTYQITQHFQRLDGQTQYRDVEALDNQMKAFVADLPPSFKMFDSDRSYDNSESCKLGSGLCSVKFDRMSVIEPYGGYGGDRVLFDETLTVGMAELWFLPVHRYYIQTEILHFTIILHVSDTTNGIQAEDMVLMDK